MTKHTSQTALASRWTNKGINSKLTASWRAQLFFFRTFFRPHKVTKSVHLPCATERRQHQGLIGVPGAAASSGHLRSLERPQRWPAPPCGMGSRPGHQATFEGVVGGSAPGRCGRRCWPNQPRSVVSWVLKGSWDLVTRVIVKVTIILIITYNPN